MSEKVGDVALTEWKRQLDSALRMVEIVVEGSRKMYEAQLEAAVEAHARAEATRQLLAKTFDPQELWKIQSEWLSASVERSLCCWQSLCETALETESSVANCLCQPEGRAGSQVPAVVAYATQAPMLQMLETARKQWQDAVRQFYVPTMIFQPETQKAA